MIFTIFAKINSYHYSLTMRDMSLNSFSHGIRMYEVPLCEVFYISIEETILSNVPGAAGDYDSDNDITVDEPF